VLAFIKNELITIGVLSDCCQNWYVFQLNFQKYFKLVFESVAKYENSEFFATAGLVLRNVAKLYTNSDVFVIQYV